jgi:hypothetical protein
MIRIEAKHGNCTGHRIDSVFKLHGPTRCHFANSVEQCENIRIISLVFPRLYVIGRKSNWEQGDYLILPLLRYSCLCYVASKDRMICHQRIGNCVKRSRRGLF